MSTLSSIDWLLIVVSLTALLLLPLVAFACLCGCRQSRGHQPTIPANPLPPPPAPKPRHPDEPNPRLLVTLEPRPR